MLPMVHGFFSPSLPTLQVRERNIIPRFTLPRARGWDCLTSLYWRGRLATHTQNLYENNLQLTVLYQTYKKRGNSEAKITRTPDKFCILREHVYIRARARAYAHARGNAIGSCTIPFKWKYIYVVGSDTLGDINRDGIGYKTHFSVFIVLMRG